MAITVKVAAERLAAIIEYNIYFAPSVDDFKYVPAWARRVMAEARAAEIHALADLKKALGQ